MTFPTQHIELDPLAYGPKRIVHDVRNALYWSGEFVAGYAADTTGATFTIYESIDGFTTALSVGTVSSFPHKTIEIECQGINFIIIELTSDGVSGTVGVTGLAKVSA